MRPNANALLVTSAILQALAAASAYAQQPAQQETGRLEEVTVTAQRRVEKLQDVPIAISAFSANELERRQITETEDIIKLVPNLYGDNSTGIGTSNNFAIRGLYNTESLATFDSPVALYVDNVLISRLGATNFSLFDVERIEVMRGPQGTLFGRNTTGGAISVTLAKPSTSFGGYLEANYGNYDHIALRGSVDVPLSDRVLTKFSGYIIDEDGYVDNLTTGGTNNGQESYGARGALRISLSDDILWDVSLEYIENKDAYIWNEIVGNDRISRSGLQALGDLVTGKKGRIPGNSNQINSLALTSNLQVDTDVGAIEIISGYRDLHHRFNLDFFDRPFPTGGYVFNSDSTHEQFTQEVKFSTSTEDGRFTLVSGVFYLSERNHTDYADIFTLAVGPNGNPLVQADRVMRNETTSYAIYSQVDYRIVPKLTATVGVRWTDESKSVDFVANPNPRVTASFNSQDLIAAGIPLEQDESIVTPRFALRWEATDDVMLFASATRGFKAGGWNARGTDPTTMQAFGPELAWSYETGVRTEWFDNRLRFNATLFYAETADLQIPTGFINQSGGVTFITRNFADFEAKGVELELSAVVAGGLNINAALGLLDTKFTNVNPEILEQQNRCRNQIALGGAQPDCGQGIITLTGDIAEPARAPDTTFTLGFDYSWLLGERLELVPSVTGRYVSAHNVSAAGLPTGEAGSRVDVGASLRLQDINQRWSVTLDCENCTDKTHLVSNIAGMQYYSAPRRWYVRARYNF